MNQELVQALTNPATYPHPVDTVIMRETHISWVFLAGDFAYKLKKPVNFGFLDYSTLELRQEFCQLELELNQRLAPDIYLNLVPLSGTPTNLSFDDASAPFEYLLKMRRFDDSLLLNNLQQQGKLEEQHLLSLAKQLAEFHLELAPGTPPEGLGTPAAIWAPVQQNFDQIRDFISEPEQLKQLKVLEEWSQDTFNRLEATFAQRLEQGFVREGHGDLHLGNATLWNDKVVAFDCIEFNQSFRWCDVMSDLAFLIMDLEDRGLVQLARTTLNHYLEQTGDYAGLQVFNFYKVYRALVRAKVGLFRLQQQGLDAQDKANIHNQYLGYVQLAESYIDFNTPYLLITHGFSGSGKSTLTKAVVQELGAIRIRSDVERKRLYGLKPEQSSNAQQVAEGIYTQAATTKTYQRLGELTTQVLSACYPVTLDATNLLFSQREQLKEVAQNLGLTALIISMQAEEATLKRRLAKRIQEGEKVAEADLRVLEHQLNNHDPLTEEELTYTVSVDTDAPAASQQLVKLIKNYLRIPS